MLPPEMLAEVAKTCCRDSMGGFIPGAIEALAEMTDLQIVEFLCHTPDTDDAPVRPESAGRDHSDKRPQTEDEYKAQWFNIGRSLISAGLAKFDEDELQKRWDEGVAYRKAKGIVIEG